MRRIDPTLGPRAAIYAHFRALAVPQFTLCAPIKVDAPRLKASGGLFPGLLWAALEAANAVPELRQRLRVEDGVDVIVEHERVDCTCTVARDDGSFGFGVFGSDPERARFIAGVPERIAAATAHSGLDLSQQGRDDMLYLTSFPWREVTGVVHASTGDPLDSVPRVMWGRAVGGRLSVCVTAHHALVDGLHVARFLAEMETRVA